jgi:hypothetical protein
VSPATGVREDVAEEVRRDDDAEALRSPHELEDDRVDVHRASGDAGIARRHLARRVLDEPRRLAEDVGFSARTTFPSRAPPRGGRPRPRSGGRRRASRSSPAIARSLPAVPRKGAKRGCAASAARTAGGGIEPLDAP